jgi:hypothetical protein
MYKIEITKIYVKGCFIYHAKTPEEEAECLRLGMHLAEEQEVLRGMRYDHMMKLDFDNTLIN